MSHVQSMPYLLIRLLRSGIKCFECMHLHTHMRVSVSKGVHELSWVGLRGFFYLTHHDESKKIQPNPTHHISLTQLTWVELGRVESMS